ncbi:DUF2232 domain-containing protein [Geotoga petraea]|uniref:DUF2232 domain-containing protein n=1 Tax=Geotoga petraea TaxID=28234 RepID=A0A1G6ILN4_9BACT|nr:DUF2232 domain-containing protein [Geotoga petraea]MDK2945295.1 hypothetical protein [Geotoga sp.]TGG89240.1 DUF2232 domain-containing protein [Geotoga petraea]SDC07384.1 Predicted membrane protein [Geotoga petraea]
MTKQISITALLTVMTVILFSSQMFIPFLGVVFTIFSTIPIMVVNMLTEKRYTIMSIIISSLLIVLFNDPFGWILFILILIPSTVSNMIEKKFYSYLLVIPVLLGNYILYSVIIIDGSNVELFLKNIWYIIGIFMFISLKYSFKKVEVLIRYKYLNKLKKEI